MNQDPKYQFGTEDKIFHREGNYWIPQDEPVIMFRGKDLGTLIAMKAYRKYMIDILDSQNTEEAKTIAQIHLSTISERIKTIDNWQRNNPDRTGLGCHTCKPNQKPHKILK